MTENTFNIQYDLTKKSKLRRFYESNKILIYVLAFIMVMLLGYLSFHLENSERKKVLASNKYVKAKIYLDQGKQSDSLKILKNVIYANDSVYSPLSFFLILNQNLIKDNKEISTLFNHLLENNNFKGEMENLLIYKKALFNSNIIDESSLLNEIKPLLNKEDSIWTAHALLLLGDYFLSKKEYIKAREFYEKIILIESLENNLLNQAKSQIASIPNEK